ncbi:MAG: methyltransferase domain-containing protein [bacterium]|nr:methyltransferase domain-containing protein [bacterium]
MFHYRCPSCRGELAYRDDHYKYHCPACQRDFLVYRGIPDFRLRSMLVQEQKEVEIILSNFDSMNYEDLLRARINFSSVPKDLLEKHLRHELLSRERGEIRLNKIKRLIDRSRQAEPACQGFHGGERCLDLGCGGGSALFALSAQFKEAIGLDISLVDLLLARKLFDTYRIGNGTLVCASGLAMPFPNECFDLINATDVIEHMPDQRGFLKEAYRVMTGGGYFCFNSPNRFNIFGPEPHVHLWGVGFLPRRYMDAYVRLFKGISYKHKKLLSVFELKRIMNGVGGVGYFISGSIVDRNLPQRSFKGRLAQKFPWMLTVANTLVKPFIPGYEVMVVKY